MGNSEARPSHREGENASLLPMGSRPPGTIPTIQRATRMREWTDPRDGVNYKLMSVVGRSEVAMWCRDGFWRLPAPEGRGLDDLSESELQELVDRARGLEPG